MDYYGFIGFWVGLGWLIPAIIVGIIIKIIKYLKEQK